MREKKLADKKGFARIRGLMAAGAVGLAGIMGGGSARAATTALPLSSVARGSARWFSIGNNSSFPSGFTVTTANGAVIPSFQTGFGITDASLASDSDAFDNFLILGVDGNLFVNPDGDVDLTGDTLTSDVVTNIVAGIDAQIQYYFAPGRPVVRALYSLTNTTGAPISVDAGVFGDYGSDSNTTIRSTSDGDNTIENSDFWYMTDEGFGSDPRITLSRYGTGATVVPINALTPGSANNQQATTGLLYPTTIPAGETRRILVFVELSNPVISEAQAVTDAADFESLQALTNAGLLVGISSTELDEVVNYGAVTSSQSAPVAVPAMGQLGLLSLLGALGGIGGLALRRRDKHAE